MKLREYGLLSKWQKNYSPDIHQCRDTKSSTDDFKPLELTRLMGAFAVLFIGYVVAFVVLIGQKINVHFRGTLAQ